MKKAILTIFILAMSLGCKSAKKSTAIEPVLLKAIIEVGLRTDSYHIKGNDVRDRNMDSETKLAWNYADDDIRCFTPTAEPDKLTDSTYDISINIGAMRRPFKNHLDLLYGKMTLHFRKDGSQWKLESVDSQDLRQEGIPEEKTEKFVNTFLREKVKPFCEYSSYVRTNSRIKL